MVRFEVKVALLAAIFAAKTNCQQISRRIMRGVEVDIGYLPWVVAFTDENLYVIGSGCILSEKWVLTVAQLWDEAVT
jgi:secreted trypsin-like serine protease